MQTHFILSLNADEVILLLDRLVNGNTVKTIEDELSPLRILVVKLGSLYTELVFPDRKLDYPVDIAVSEAEAWLLRSHVKTPDVALDGKTNIGINLNRKLLGILVQFEKDEMELGEDAEEPQVTRLEEWKNANRVASPDTNGSADSESGD